MLLSEGVKRYASSSLGSDNALRLRSNKTFHHAYQLFWQAHLHGWIAIEQLCAADMCFAHAADLGR